ncbi:MAG: hypothetical protein ACRDDX_03520 [Cellulosilyticaceae bacterium]
MMRLEEVLNFNFAEDIREEWDSYMEDGYTIEDATTQLVDQYDEVLEADEKVLFYMTMVLIQVELEWIDSRIKEEVNEILKTKEMDGLLEDTKECKRMLQLLKKRCR